MINIILEGYYNPAIKLREHLIREMNKSELTKIEFLDSLLFALTPLKNKIEQSYYKDLPYNEGMNLLKQGLPLIWINPYGKGHIYYEEILDIIDLIESMKKIENMQDILAVLKQKADLLKTNLSHENTFFDYIHNVKDIEAFAIELKETFNNETKTSFCIMINLLENEGIFKYSAFAPFYRKIKQYFDREIGNQNTMNDALKRIKSGIPTRERELNKITEKVNVLINKHKKLNEVV